MRLHNARLDIVPDAAMVCNWPFCWPPYWGRSHSCAGCLEGSQLPMPWQAPKHLHPQCFLPLVHRASQCSEYLPLVAPSVIVISRSGCCPVALSQRPTLHKPVALPNVPLIDPGHIGTIPCSGHVIQYWRRCVFMLKISKFGHGLGMVWAWFGHGLGMVRLSATMLYRSGSRLRTLNDGYVLRPPVRACAEPTIGASNLAAAVIVALAGIARAGNGCGR